MLHIAVFFSGAFVFTFIDCLIIKQRRQGWAKYMANVFVEDRLIALKSIIDVN